MGLGCGGIQLIRDRSIIKGVKGSYSSFSHYWMLVQSIRLARMVISILSIL